MKKIILYLLTIILFFPEIESVLAGERKVGTTAANFLKIETGIKGVGMGGAFCGLADNVSGSMYWNAGGLGFIEKREAEFSYNSWFQDINQGYLSYGHPTIFGTLALGVSYLNAGKMKETDSDPYGRYIVKKDEFTAGNMLVQIGYGSDILSKKLGIGGSIKYITDTIKDDTKSAFAVDLGMLYKTPIQNLNCGLSMRNTGKKLADYSLPLIIQFGSSYRLKNLVVTTDINLPSDDKINYRFGVEYTLLSLLSFRSGYNFAVTDDKLGNYQDITAGITFGLGFNIKSSYLDYTFVPYGDLGITHRISLGIKFGKL